MKKLNFPIVTNNSCKTLAQDIVSVTPNEEKGELISTIEHHSDEEIIYDKVITEENIDKYRKLFKTDNLFLNDGIETWDDGGWLTLSGRAGLKLIRDGKLIKKILTRMS